MEIVNTQEKLKDIDLSTGETYEKVQEWLQNLYNESKIPEFEVNEITINILCKIMECNLRADTEGKEMIKHQLYSEEWYIKEGEKIDKALDIAGVKTNLFSELCQGAISSLAMSSCALDLKDSSQTSFLLGLNALSREQGSSLRRKTSQLYLSSKLSNKLNSILLKTQHLQRDLQNAKDAAEAQTQQEEKRVRQIEFLQNKQEEYCRTVKNLEDQLVLSSSGDNSIYHSTLVKKSQELKILCEKLNDVTAKLSSYQNLPPNENLARLKIEESKEELSRLEKELQMNIYSK